MSDNLLVQLSTDKVVMEPGGTPFELQATVQNRGNVIDQYTLDLTGLDRDWFSASVTSVAAFPDDRIPVRIMLHPPRRPGLRAGAYPFRILVRSRETNEQASVDATLQVHGIPVPRVDITPRRQTARGTGTFKLQIANTGNADVRLAVEARDAENACRIDIGDREPLVSAGSRKEVSVKVRPLKRTWIGPERPYDFTVTAKPQDAGGEPQTVPAQFTHKPLFASWSPLFMLGKLLAALIAVIGLLGILASFGIVEKLPQSFQSGTAIAKGVMCRAPLIQCDPLDAIKTTNQSSGAKCQFDFGFKEFAEAEPEMVGECASDVYYDRYGNGFQYTRDGMFVWQKDSNTVYYYRRSSIWARIQGHTEKLYGTGDF